MDGRRVLVCTQVTGIVLTGMRVAKLKVIIRGEDIED